MAHTRMCTGAVLWLSLLSLVARARCHIYMRSPMARQALDPWEFNEASHDGRDPNNPGSICGDGGRSNTEVFGQRARFGIPPENHIRAGQKLGIVVYVKAGHLGRFSYYLCQYRGNETAATVNQACFNKHKLKPVEGQKQVIPPYDYYWLGAVGPGNVTMYYYVPSDVNCDGVTTFCILQFNYESGNTCNPPGFCPFYNNITRCNRWLSWCGNTSELYRNCADVVITGGTKAALPTPKPQITQPVDRCCFGKADGLHRNPSNCRRVCKCSKGKTIQRLACRVGFNFDDVRKKCRASYVYRC